MTCLRLYFLLICIGLFYKLPAQQKPPGDGKIFGKIIDSLTKQPLEYCTISLVKKGENKVVDGTTSDDKGVFKISGIAAGDFNMVIFFIGYKTATVNLTISQSKPEVSLGAIKLVNKQLQLTEVLVVTEKSLIENKIDKMVYNAEKDITSQGGVATDILKKIPMVAVNADGSIELQGNSNIRFLINGKPSSVFGNSIADVLQTIPASQIQSIEVITSPGAKYDAEGTGGIINIILKKVTVQGINGSLSLTGGTRLENGSFNLAYRQGKFAMNTFLSGNGQLLSTTVNNLDRESTDHSSSLLQNGNSNFMRYGGQTGLSFEWEISKQNNLTGGFTYNNMANSNSGTTDRQTITRDSTGAILSNLSNAVFADNTFSAQTFDWNLNYKKKFKKEGRELDILYTASRSENYSYYLQTQKFISTDVIYNGSYGKNPGTDMQNNLSVNYIHPISEKFSFETGTKAILYQINNNSNVYLLNASSNDYFLNNSQSSSINYTRGVYSAYVSTTLKLKIFDIKAGIRDEYTETKANFSGVSNANINPYNTLVPSGVISRNFKNNHTLKVSYSYRIQRPDYRDLNPFLNASDPKNITTGNTALKPETAHNIELGYSKFFEKGINISVNAFYRGNRADIQAYQQYYSNFLIGDSTYNNVTVSTRENIGREDNFGLNIFGSVNIKKKFNLRTNISAFQRYIYNSIVPGANINGFNYRINVNGSYQITETIIAEVFGNFNSPRINVQGKMPAFTTYNFAIRKQFYHNKMSIAFTTTNPFNKYVDQRTETTGTNFTLTSLKQMPYRSFGINFLWKFGKLEFKKQKDNEDANLTNPPVQGN